MPRPRRTSTLSTRSTGADHHYQDVGSSSSGGGGAVGSAGGEPSGGQEMGSMYDYLAKIILLGPSGSGKSCLLHRFVKDEWRVLSSQTIGVEFASKIVKVGGTDGTSSNSSHNQRYSFAAAAGGRRKRIKLQLWDTAGTERFRSVSRSYYRGAAGALLVYDVANPRSFAELPTFLNDARALASPQLTVLLVGNKLDLAEGAPSPPQLPSSSLQRQRSLLDSQPEEEEEEEEQQQQQQGEVRDDVDRDDENEADSAPLGASLRSTATTTSSSTITGLAAPTLGSQQRATVSSEGRKVLAASAANWATQQRIPGVAEVSALSGAGVDELFNRLARTILTKIELGEIDPDDPRSGIQYGDADYYYRYNDDGGSSTKSGSGGLTSDGYGGSTRRRRRRGGWAGALRLGGGGGGGGGGASGSNRGKCC